LLYDLWLIIFCSETSKVWSPLKSLSGIDQDPVQEAGEVSGDVT
jgi:hypothetical protein